MDENKIEEEFNTDDYICLDKRSPEYRILKRIFFQLFLIRLVPVLLLLLSIFGLTYVIISNIQSTEISIFRISLSSLMIFFLLYILKGGVKDLISAGMILHFIFKLKDAYVKIPTLDKESENIQNASIDNAKYKIEVRNAALVGNPEIALIEEAEVPYIDYYRNRSENILTIFFKELNDAKAARNVLRFSDYNCSYAEEIMSESSAEVIV